MSARDVPLLARSELGFLRELVRRRVEFMLVGLSAAALQGAPVVTQDVDLWFRDITDDRIRTALKKVGGSYLPSIDHHPPMFLGEAVKLFDIVMHMDGIGSFSEERKRAIRIRVGSVTVPVLPLDRILQSKRVLGRPKDQLYLKVLADALRAAQKPAGIR